MEVLISNTDTQLFCTIQPQENKETVVLLHGGPGVPEGLTFLTDFLKPHFQVISFHQRGTRKSPTFTHDFSLNRFIADINYLAEYFKLEKFHLFGHSWGGLYAQLYAHNNPEKLLSLFLCSPGPGTGRQWQETILEAAQYNKGKCSQREWLAMNLYSVLGLLGSNRAYRKFYGQALLNFSRGFTESHPEYFAIDCIRAKAITRTTKAILQHPSLPEKIIPDYNTTLTFGDDDIFGESKKYVIQRFPTAAFHIIPASGHLPWSHNQKAFVAVLEQHYRIK